MEIIIGLGVLVLVYIFRQQLFGGGVNNKLEGLSKDISSLEKDVDDIIRSAPTKSQQDNLKALSLSMRKANGSKISKKDQEWLDAHDVSKKQNEESVLHELNNSLPLQITKEEYDLYLKPLRKWFVIEEDESMFYSLDKVGMLKYKLDSIFNTYGEEVTRKIIRKEVWLNMSREELLESKGKPDDKIEKVSRGKVREEYFYGAYKNRQKNTSYKFRVVLIDGKVDGWNDIN